MLPGRVADGFIVGEALTVENKLSDVAGLARKAEKGGSVSVRGVTPRCHATRSCGGCRRWLLPVGPYSPDAQEGDRVGAKVGEAATGREERVVKALVVAVCADEKKKVVGEVKQRQWGERAHRTGRGRTTAGGNGRFALATPKLHGRPAAGRGRARTATTRRLSHKQGRPDGDDRPGHRCSSVAFREGGGHV